ncbi:hypothetical protein PG993_012335 [Apiospora rasikravindrae]|uniref:Uncharacterized protein n=1 Tax=Apiospora rasikravindrae TaxID=990691 RepID=A0ABR1S274_9PEZI
MATTQDQKTPMATASTTAADDTPPYTESQRADLTAAVAQAESGNANLAVTSDRASLDSAYTTNTSSPLLSGGGGADDRLRKYNMYYTTSRLSTLLHRGKRETTQAEYYMQSDILAAAGEPQMLLRRQPTSDKSGAVVAWGLLVLFPWRHCFIGLGDPHAATGGIKLHRDKNFLHRSDWRFSTAVGSAAGDDGSKLVEYVWRKDMAKYGTTIYKCVAAGDENKIYARLLSGGGLNGKKGGEIMIREGLEGGLEELLLVSGQTIWAWEALDYQSLRQGYSKSDKSKSDKSKSD